jgi:hypothetical protein
VKVADLAAALIVIGRAVKTMLVAEEEITVKFESAAFVAVTEHVSALLTVRESVLVMLQPALPVTYVTAPVPEPPVVVSRNVVP